MRITKKQLTHIIQEEIQAVLQTQSLSQRRPRSGELRYIVLEELNTLLSEQPDPWDPGFPTPGGDPEFPVPDDVPDDMPVPDADDLDMPEFPEPPGGITMGEGPWDEQRPPGMPKPSWPGPPLPEDESTRPPWTTPPNVPRPPQEDSPPPYPHPEDGPVPPRPPWDDWPSSPEEDPPVRPPEPIIMGEGPWDEPPPFTRTTTWPTPGGGQPSPSTPWPDPWDHPPASPKDIGRGPSTWPADPPYTDMPVPDDDYFDEPYDEWSGWSGIPDDIGGDPRYLPSDAIRRLPAWPGPPEDAGEPARPPAGGDWLPPTEKPDPKRGVWPQDPAIPGVTPPWRPDRSVPGLPGAVTLPSWPGDVSKPVNLPYDPNSPETQIELYENVIRAVYNQFKRRRR